MNKNKILIIRKDIKSRINAIRCSTAKIKGNKTRTIHRLFPFGAKKCLNYLLHYSDKDLYNKALYTRQVACNIRNKKNENEHPFYFSNLGDEMDNKLSEACNNYPKVKPRTLALLLTTERVDDSFLKDALGNKQQNFKKAVNIIKNTTITIGKKNRQKKLENIVQLKNKSNWDLLAASMVNNIARNLAKNNDFSISWSDIEKELPRHIKAYTKDLKNGRQWTPRRQDFIRTFYWNFLLNAGLNLFDYTAKLVLGAGLSLTSFQVIICLGIALWLFYTTLPITTALLTSIHDELSHIGSHSISTAFSNVFTACTESWKKAVENPNRFHPVTEGFLFSFSLFLLYVPVIKYVLKGNQFFWYYPLFMTFWNVKKEVQDGKSNKQVFSSSIKSLLQGFVRCGLLKWTMKSLVLYPIIMPMLENNADEGICLA